MIKEQKHTLDSYSPTPPELTTRGREKEEYGKVGFSHVYNAMLYFWGK